MNDPAVLEQAYEPYPAEAMRVYQVGRLVNSPKNDNPNCIVPVA